MRVLGWLMAMLFLIAAGVQWNDPDPLRWVAIYTAACVVSLVVATRGGIARRYPLAVAAVALVWAATIAAGGPAADAYSHMFDAWKMAASAAEEAREATGLIVVAAWMAVLASRSKP